MTAIQIIGIVVVALIGLYALYGLYDIGRFDKKKRNSDTKQATNQSIIN